MLSIPQRLTAAVQHHQAGRLAEAEALYRGVLQEDPLQPHALHLLGVLAHQTGRPQEAIDLITRALAVHGPHPEFHNNLGAACLAAGRLAEAEAHFRRAVQLKPDYADAHYNVGVALRRQGRAAEAAQAFREALRLNPNHAGALRQLGPAAPQEGNLAGALAALRELVRREPGNARAHNDLGLLLLANGEPERAAHHLENAVRLQPSSAEAWCNLGVARRHLRRTDEALECFRQALRVSPAYGQARSSLAAALQAQGRLDEALAEVRETLRADPSNAHALHALSEMAAAGHYTFSADEARALRELVARPGLQPADRIHLHFALARALDQGGQPDEAFAHYRRANELRQEIDRACGVAYDPAAHHRFVDRLMATFTPAWFESARSFGVDSELPVFVVGMPRSGTTLAEQVLASHPQAHGAGELEEIDRLARALPERLGTAEPYPECLARLSPPVARALAEGHLQVLRRLGGAAARVVDKLPLNFLHLGLIATLFPKAKIVHCRRGPIDTCLSCYFQNFAGPFPWARDLGHLGHYHREHERLMAHWARALPVPVFELRYEDFTADQEATTRRLLDFCGLSWDERCLRFHETRREVSTASGLQVRRPMYRSSVGRWKRYEAHLGPLLAALNGGEARGQVTA
jgi:tetratricopeptide (TPR) repeat protein